jgi:benzoyl-CoA reductase/2-hydroxyglutaryl-CoA dehydratase subunit BcrC/BadD/HgdB
MEEPLEYYLEFFERYQADVEELFETTIDLTDLDRDAINMLSSQKLLYAFCYLAGPPISMDDLKTVAAVSNLNRNRQGGFSRRKPRWESGSRGTRGDGC